MNLFQISAVLERLLTDGKLPQVIFFKDSPFAVAVDALARSSARAAGVTDNEAVATWVAKLSAEGGLDVLQQLCEEAAYVISDGLTTASATVTDINTQVASFIKTIEDAVGRRIALDPRLLQSADSAKDYKYQVLDYSPLSKIAGSVAQMKSMDEVISGVDGATMTNYIGIREKYVNMKVRSTARYDYIFTDEHKASIVAELNTANPTFNTDTIKQALVLVSRASNVETFLSDAQRVMELKSDYTEGMVEALSVIDMYGALLPKLHDKLLGMDLLSDSLAVNFDKAMAVLEMYFYFVQYHRVGIYQDTVLFKNQLRNPDLAAKLMAAGFTDLDITKHLGVIWKGDILQAVGITLTSLLANKERVDKEYTDGVAADELYRKHTLADIYRTVTCKVLSEHFKALNLDVYEYVCAKTDGLAVGGEALEDIIFNVIVTYQYQSNLVLTTIYKKLGVAYIQAVKNNPGVSADMITNINIDILLEVAASVITKKLLS